MQSFRTRLEQSGVIVADGAMGTMLLRRGLSPGDCPEKINLESSELLEDIARAYLAAGAEIVQTNTFGASPLKLAMYGLDRKTDEINAAAVRAARNVVGDQAYVALSCGPSGKILEPYGDTGTDDVYESFRRQSVAAVAEGIDLICVETMTDLREATLAISAARSVSPTIPICATMTFDETPRGFFTMMGNSVEQAADDLAGIGADVIGSNCGNGILKMIKIAREFKRHSTLPIMIQSNAGIPQLKDGTSVYPESPEFMAEECLELLSIGVKIIGGCCGTTPEHIAAIRQSVTKFGLQ